MQVLHARGILTKYLVTILTSISLKTCTRECEGRDECGLVVYNNRLHKCELHSPSADQSSNLATVPGLVTVRGFQTCSANSACQGAGRTKDCASPVAAGYPNYEGNMFSVNSTLLAPMELIDSTFTTQIKCFMGDTAVWNVHCSGCKPCVYDLARDARGLGHVCPNKRNYPACSCDSDGNDWLVFQRRFDGSVNFLRTWTDYVSGFGDVEEGEYWLGLEHLHQIVSTFPGQYELRVDMEMFNGTQYFARYLTFDLTGDSDNYRLNVSGYSGDAGDSLGIHDGMQFSTYDADHDTHSGNCAAWFKGAWWYKHCHSSNLNGEYYPVSYSVSRADHVHWFAITTFHHSLKATEMKIRRRQDYT